ncbi:unnamed protein product [Prorocentrum cordatum]|uniref:Uncharacterized protein n=1 Tax=Prorocentrum cordatum TaxID=2364126 RepID=A0ABN9TGG4_9DINO|nr:unnamed protein product [Polarella glacialis]
MAPRQPSELGRGTSGACSRMQSVLSPDFSCRRLRFCPVARGWLCGRMAPRQTSELGRGTSGAQHLLIFTEARRLRQRHQGLTEAAGHSRWPPEEEERVAGTLERALVPMGIDWGEGSIEDETRASSGFL